ncbi:HTH-type quorum sensing-dependent transcriptional regulator VjbR [Jannaschia aquimarina]|uniref:VjbR protein n=1 Tax=Jannaschia aquimarina TaxID=935700 RepID=A0A0D1EKY7_9RHOB|nr:LuxR family transcriptional regulator [Jannaschia aquimarina]KIT17651.1 HTH-type quorum sensing-dependent transcriptional regulator VjbR [Jannaschia aquimarina]SNS79938.1 regulatory protein, luxR family [Jannaschia aquimarina]
MQTELRLGELCERLSEAQDHDDLARAVAGLRDTYDVEHVVYHCVRSGGEQWGALTYPKEWVDAYVKEDFKSIDPVVAACFSRPTPVDWKALDWSARPARELLGSATASGLGSQGCSLGVRGPSGRYALFSVNDRMSDGLRSRFTDARVDEMILAAHYIDSRAQEMEAEPVAKLRTLSPRETDALTLLAKGLGRAQAAERLAISEHTFRVYVESARNKLGARNTLHAVAHAMSLGLICL